MYNALFQNLACSHSIIQPCYSQLVHVCYQSKNMYLINICINMLNNVSIDWISGFRLNCNPHLHDTSTIASIVEFMRQNCKQELNIRACLTLMLCDYFWKAISTLNIKTKIMIILKPKRTAISLNIDTVCIISSSGKETYGDEFISLRIQTALLLRGKCFKKCEFFFNNCKETRNFRNNKKPRNLLLISQIFSMIT